MAARINSLRTRVEKRALLRLFVSHMYVRTELNPDAYPEMKR